MKNRPLKFALALTCLCALSACDSVNDWAHNKPSTIDKTLGTAPTGYGQQPHEQQPAPAAAPESYAAPVETQPGPVIVSSTGSTSAASNGTFNNDNLAWHQIKNYNAANPSLPAGGQELSPSGKPAGPAVIQYNHSVDVYPVNADITPYAEGSYVNISAASGELIQQIFFPYGSSHLSGIDRQNLRELAQSLVQNGSEYKLDVIGHASRTVNHVRDALRRKMINFKMAQKRANAVAQELIRAGATPDWVEVSSLGDTQPNRHRNGKSQEAADRRTEVYLNK
jgi:outer membrane protein OmpA-like peptidoglycan-associated protein